MRFILSLAAGAWLIGAPPGAGDHSPPLPPSVVIPVNPMRQAPPEGLATFHNHTAVRFVRGPASGWDTPPARELAAGAWEPAGLGVQRRDNRHASAVYNSVDNSAGCAFELDKMVNATSGACELDVRASARGDVLCRVARRDRDPKTCDLTVVFEIRPPAQP